MKTPGIFSTPSEETDASALFNKSASAFADMYYKQLQFGKEMMAGFLKSGGKKTGHMSFFPGMEMMQKNFLDLTMISGKMISSAVETYFSLIEKTTRDAQEMFSRISRQNEIFAENALKPGHETPLNKKREVTKRPDVKRPVSKSKQ